MDFFNGFGRKVNRVVRSVAEKTGEGAGLARVAGELRTLGAERDRLYGELGRIFYAMRAGEGGEDAARSLCEQLDALEARIAELTEQRENLKLQRRCPACGTMLGREARYCSNCGKRLQEDVAVNDAPDADADYCPNCGAVRMGGETVCALCGRPFAAQDPVEAPAPEPAPVPDIDTEEPAPADAEETDG